MIAYNKEGLWHLLIRKDVEDAFAGNCITEEEHDAINSTYSFSFYTPNFFIRIGLFILTIIVMFFSYGLLLLLFMNSIEKMLGPLAIFLSVISYLFLEYIVREKKHYCSGVDDALLWGSAIALFAGISLPHDFSGLVNCIIVFMITLFGCLRFADRLMAVVCYIALMGILFYTCLEFGNAAKAIIPFIMMGTSMFIYFIVKKLRSLQFAIHYSHCLQMINITALTSFYIAGNYFVVRELSNSMFNMNLQPGESIPFGWLFWIFTIIIPLIYIARGVQKKDVILLRVGLLLIAAIVITVRHYHNILTLETMLSLGGVMLLFTGYLLMRYLQKPKHGFTYQEISKTKTLDKLNVESIIIAQTFPAGTESGGTKFGGGSFGGGGASGEY